MTQEQCARIYETCYMRLFSFVMTLSGDRSLAEELTQETFYRAFTASLILLLGVTCIVTRGNWFWVASSAVLFGFSVCFLPFAIKAKPVRKWVDGRNKVLIVLGVDAVLFLNMMNAILVHGNGGVGFWTTAGIVAVITLGVLYVMKKRSTEK